MGTRNVSLSRPQRHGCLLRGGESQEGEKLARLGAEGALPDSTEPCLDAKTVLLGPVFPIPQEPWGRGPERPLLGGKTEWEVARATEFQWVLEKAGFLHFPSHPICL